MVLNNLFILIFLYIVKKKIKFGFIIDYFYIQNTFNICCYKDISKTEEYLLYRALNIIKNTEIQYYFTNRFIYY